MSKTLEQLEDEMYAARDVYDAAPEGSDAEDDAGAAWLAAQDAYNNKLKETEGEEMKTLEELKQEMDAAWDARAAVYAAAAWEAADNAYEDAWDAYAAARVAYHKKLREEADENT